MAILLLTLLHGCVVGPGPAYDYGPVAPGPYYSAPYAFQGGVIIGPRFHHEHFYGERHFREHEGFHGSRFGHFRGEHFRGGHFRGEHARGGHFGFHGDHDRR